MLTIITGSTTELPSTTTLTAYGTFTLADYVPDRARFGVKDVFANENTIYAFLKNGSIVAWGTDESRAFQAIPKKTR